MNIAARIGSASKSKYVEEVAAAALALSAVNKSIAQTCLKLDDLHVELQKRDLKHFNESGS